MTSPEMTAERALAVFDRLEWCENGCCPSCGAWVGRAQKTHDCQLTQARDYFAALVEQTTWRPIETAPKDGSVIMYCDTSGNRWTDASPGCIGNGCGLPAVAWMPLPASPEPQE